MITPTARAPLDSTPSVCQPSANFDRGPSMKGESSSRKRRSKLGEAEDEVGQEAEETEVAAALAGASEAAEAPNIAFYNQSLVSSAEPKFLKMMGQMTQFMGQLTQAVSPRDNSRSPVFKTPSMKAPDSLDGTKAHKLRGFIQSYLHNGTSFGMGNIKYGRFLPC
ncbi:hypothetical protein O181_009537 [Austropuccinia psidii MF-1]|uniref:Uncharacterized protein n=1 Tax=Austropuccinia psidii MF-1 TaxID=1389203 RepID=A0A9Q3BQY8_9BASI|nr:hypothetical protein [Austropuccinia psidii MF-1]